MLETLTKEFEAVQAQDVVRSKESEMKLEGKKAIMTDSTTGSRLENRSAVGDCDHRFLVLIVFLIGQL